MAASGTRVGASLTLCSTLSVQVGAAVSTHLFGRVGPGGTNTLRLVWAGVLLLVVVRPRPSRLVGGAWKACAALGITTAAMTGCYLAALARLPLGTTSALEFLGPLAVALARGRGAAKLWAVLAGAGVLALTSPWEGRVDGIGVLYALVAAACWATYILLTQRVGDAVSGLDGLAVAMGVAGLATIAVSGHDVVGHLTIGLVFAGLGLAVLTPVVPFSLEYLALRRLSAAAFGTLMSLEPAIGLVVGLVFLGQVPGIGSVLGIGLVVAAGVGATRTGARAGAAGQFVLP